MALAMVVTPSHAATKKPTPKPTIKVSAKATTKAKAPAKKKVVKKKPRKKVTVAPSPKPKWPPTGFKASGEVYAKIPSAKELVGAASSSKALTRQLAEKVDGVAVCEKYSCGAVQVASLNGCLWWEISAVVGEVSADKKSIKPAGVIRTTLGETSAKQISTALLVSKDPLELNHTVTNMSINCHHEVTTEKIPGSTYILAAN